MEGTPQPPILSQFIQQGSKTYTAPEINVELNGAIFPYHQRHALDSSLVPPTLKSKTPNAANHSDEETDIGQISSILPGQSFRGNISKKWTCSLNLVCYRSGTRGCESVQVRVVKKDDSAEFEEVVRNNQSLIKTDQDFFKALRSAYRSQMCSLWRRMFTLKTLCGMRLLSYNPKTRPTVVPLDEFTLQEILYAYHNPSHVSTKSEWIDWVFKLRQPDKRHALEFVEGWNGLRISILGFGVWLASTLVGVIWSARTGDVVSAFTVALFILTSGTLILALLAILSGIESSEKH